MAGQPEGHFNVTKLEVIETVNGTEVPSNIVDAGETIKLRVTITGSDLGGGLYPWTNFKDSGFRVRAYFYVEGMGPWVWNQTFGVKYHVIDKDTITVDSDPVAAPGSGLYRCGVVVNVVTPAALGTRYQYGWLGFNEDCVFQVHWAEEPG